MKIFISVMLSFLLQLNVSPLPKINTGIENVKEKFLPYCCFICNI